MSNIEAYLEYVQMLSKASGITEAQRKLISRLKNIGYGYAEFAKSVEKSGKCTEAQHRKLQEMVNKTNSYKGTGYGSQ